MYGFNLRNWRNLSEARYNHKLSCQSSLSPESYSSATLIKNDIDEIYRKVNITNVDKLNNNTNKIEINPIITTPLRNSPRVDQKKQSPLKKSLTRREKVMATKIVKAEGSVVTVRKALELYTELLNTKPTDTPSSHTKRNIRTSKLDSIRTVLYPNKLIMATKLKREDETSDTSKNSSKDFDSKVKLSRSKMNTDKVHNYLHYISKKENTKDILNTVRNDFLNGLSNMKMKDDDSKDIKEDTTKSLYKYKELIKVDNARIHKEISYKLTKLEEAIARSKTQFRFTYKLAY